MEEVAFRHYTDIENVVRTKFMNDIAQQGKTGGRWCVTEKIHGANFSFWVTEDGIMCAKRTDWLSEGANFFNWQDVLRKYELNLRKMFESIKSERPGLACMTVYGELFGGTYPHPDVDRVYMSQCVQKGVYYCPDNDFAAFDIVLNDGNFMEMQSWDFVQLKCFEVGIPTVPPLFEGTMEECLAHSNEFITRVPLGYGLPEIADNICEGIVIKPVVPAYLFCGSRVIIKSKNVKWQEKAKRQKPVGDENKANKFDFEPSPEAAALMEELMAHVTENRLHNVLSKMEQITDRMFGNVVGNMSKDAIDDFMKDSRDAFMTLEEKERKLLTKRLSGAVMELVRHNFVNILDGTF